MNLQSTRSLKMLVMLLSIFGSSAIQAGSAFWTGKSQVVQTVTNKIAWECEYNYNGSTFTKVFESTCPSSVNVETPSGSYNQKSTSSYSGYAQKAYWTGQSDSVQDANYQIVWRCIYDYNGQKIARLFKLTCPNSIDVR